MARTDGAPPALEFEGRRFVGVRVETPVKPDEVVVYRPGMYTGTVPFILAQPRPDQTKVFGSIFTFTPTQRGDAALRTITSVMMTTDADPRLPGLLTVTFRHDDRRIEAVKPWSMLTAVDVVESRECEPPEIYRGPTPRRDDALVLRLLFSDGECLPLTYATPVEGTDIGTRADLEAKAVQIRETIDTIRQLSATQPLPPPRPPRQGEPGVRLGEPFVYAWTDLEPTSTTYADRAKSWSRVWAAVFLAIIATFGWSLGAEFGLLVAFVYGLGVALIAGTLVTWWLRRDDAPVPRAVRREAYIARFGGEYRFMLEVEGKQFLWGHWADVQQFEVTPYWAMFGDGSRSPVESEWHAIVMDPGEGQPWRIASTIEGMAVLRERRAALDARFGVTARTLFMAELNRPRLAPAADASSTPGAANGVPREI